MDLPGDRSTDSPERQQGFSLWWRLLPEEPFRLFFPLGILAAVVGVSLWPLHYLDFGLAYPAIPHARILFHGFIFAFIVGFLGTAGPRMLEVDPFPRSVVALLVLLWTLSLGCHLCGLIRWGDFAFLANIGLLAGIFLSRWPKRKDLPPPGFVLAGAGIGLGAVGTLLLQIAPHLNWTGLSSFVWYEWGKLFLFQGMALLPILGVAGFFFGRFFGSPSGDRQPGTRFPDTAYRKNATEALLVAAGLGITFILEGLGHPILANLLKTALVLLHLRLRVPILPSGSHGPTVARMARAAVALLLLGTLLPTFAPGQSIALRHILFIGAFTVTLLAVSSWVAFAHAGRRQSLEGKNTWMPIALILLAITLLTRVWADFLPLGRENHLSYAAIFWIFAMALWALKLVPRVLEEDP